MAKKVIPFGDRILVKRRKIGEKIGSAGVIIAADETKDRPTDLADVVHIPEHTFTDKKLVENSEKIIDVLITKAKNGCSDSLISLLRYNEFLKIKSIKVDDAVMIGKYVGTDFHASDTDEDLTLVKGEDIIGLVVDG